MARKPGWWYPWIFVGGFAVVFAVNMTMVKFATSTFSGLAVERAFEKGNAYNAEIAAEQAQAQLGWTAAFGIAESTPEDDDVRLVRWRFTVSDKTGRPVDGLAVAARIERPTVTGHDVDMSLRPTGPGTYEATTRLPFKGQWEVRLTATRPGQPAYRLRDRVKVP